MEIEIPGKRKRKIPSHLAKDYLMPRRARRNSDPDYEPDTADTVEDDKAAASRGKLCCCDAFLVID